MDSDGDAARIRQVLADAIAKRDAKLASIARLEESIKDIDSPNDAVFNSITGLKLEQSVLDKSIEFHLSNIDRSNEQINFYDNVIRPQQLKGVKESHERLEIKRAEHKKMLEHYDKIWEGYEVVYNRFPRVAERNELVNKLKLLKIEEMKKRQLVVEKARQAEQLQEIKLRQLELLKSEFLECFNREQEESEELVKLVQENEEIRARIAEKERELAEQRKLDEEQRQLQAAHTESERLEIELPQAEQSTPTPTVAINIPMIPAFCLPSWENIQALMTPRKISHSLSQVTSLPSSLMGRNEKGIPKLPLSQPAKPTHVRTSAPEVNVTVNHAVKPCARDVSLTSMRQSAVSLETVQSNSNPSEGNVSSNESTGVKKIHEHTVQRPRESLLDVPRKNSSIPISSQQEVNIVSSANSKKESIFSTDNIVAKVKEAGQSYPKRSHEDTREFLTKKKVKNDSSTTIHCSGGYQNTFEKNVQQNSDENQADLIQNASEVSEVSDSAQEDVLSFHSSENFNSPRENDDAYNFNADYGDDMFAAMQSPPPFDGPMSPAHASFEGSAKSLDEDLQDDGNLTSFSVFPYFSKPTTNVFGGPSTSENAESKKEKSSNIFSFF